MGNVGMKVTHALKLIISFPHVSLLWLQVNFTFTMTPPGSVKTISDSLEVT